MSMKHADYMAEKAEREYNDYFMGLVVKVNVGDGEMVEAAKTAAREWTERVMRNGGKLSLRYFLDECPEWNFPDLYDALESTIERVALECWD